MHALQACAAHGQSRRCESLLASMAALTGAPPPPDAYAHAIAACSERQEWRELLALYAAARAVPGARVLARSHHAAVIAHGKLGDADAALALFHELPDLLGGNGAAADEAAAARSTLAYNAALIACTSCAEHGRAADLVAQMRAEGVPLNPLTYTAAIAAAQTLGKPDEALALFEEMQSSQAVGQLDVGRVGWDWRNALDLLAQARGARLPMRAAAFNEALGACVRARQWEAALALLEQMSSAGVPRDATTLGLAAQTAAGRGDWRMAATLLTELGAVGDAPPPDAAVAAARRASSPFGTPPSS